MNTIVPRDVMSRIRTIIPAMMVLMALRRLNNRRMTPCLLLLGQLDATIEMRGIVTEYSYPR
jgi:hypothetical protein